MNTKSLLTTLALAALILAACTTGNRSNSRGSGQVGQGGGMGQSAGGGMMGQSGAVNPGGQQENTPGSQMGPGGQTGGGQAPQSETVSPENGDVANGERIYFTATNESGQRFTYTGGPDFGGMMMGSYLTCASCHGPEARGGQHVMHMQIMYAPPIYGEALSGHDDEHDEGQTDTDAAHAEQGAYTLEEFRMAVVEGQHPDGESLDQDMPRWNIDDQNLADLLAFLKSLPGG